LLIWLSYCYFIEESMCRVSCTLQCTLQQNLLLFDSWENGPCFQIFYYKCSVGLPYDKFPCPWLMGEGIFLILCFYENVSMLLKTIMILCFIFLLSYQYCDFLHINCEHTFLVNLCFVFWTHLALKFLIIILIFNVNDMFWFCTE